MPHDTPLLATLAAGFVFAFVFGALAQRLRLSPLVGYLLAGVAVGPFTPGIVVDQALANELSEIGVILLMFGVGLHFSLQDLLAVRKIAVPGALAQITVATFLGWLLATAMGWPTIPGLVFGLALSVASTVVLLRAMEDRRMLDTGRGQIAVGWLIVEDLAMVLALVLLPVLAQSSQSSLGITELIWAFVLPLLKVGLFASLTLLIGGRIIPRLLENIAATGSRELFTLAVLAIALGVAFASAKLFGVSFALGAFFAGMLLNRSELSHQAAADSLPLRDAFAVLFFVAVGMLFDPHILIEQPLQVIGVVAIIVLGKSAAAWLIVRSFGHPPGTAWLISASLAQIGEFSFILASLGVGLGLLPEEGRDLILAGALLSIVINPLLFAALDARQARRDADDLAAAAVIPMPSNPRLEGEDHAIVIGYGRVGSHLATLLRKKGIPVMVIDDRDERVAAARAAGLPAVLGNAANPRVLGEAAPTLARIAAIAIPRALEAGEIIDRLRSANPGITVFARAHSEVEVRHLLEHGADAAVLAERELACSMAEMVLATPPYRRRLNL